MLIIYFMIGLIPYVGALLVALLGFIDAILGVPCWARIRPSTEYLADGIKWWIYGAEVMVSLDTDGKIEDFSITDPAKGLVVGNSAVVTMSLIYTSTLVKPETSPWPGAYKYEYNDIASKSTTVKSCLSRTNVTVTAVGRSAAEFEMQGEWTKWHVEDKWVLHEMQQAETAPKQLVSPPARLDHAGLNRTLPLNLIVARTFRSSSAGTSSTASPSVTAATMRRTTRPSTLA